MFPSPADVAFRIRFVGQRGSQRRKDRIAPQPEADAGEQVHGPVRAEEIASPDFEPAARRQLQVILGRAAGAVVLGQPVDQDYGYRTYRAIDPEGHRWYFAGALRPCPGG